MRFRYLHYDVFTDEPFSGNQLAVFPNAEGLDAERMQRIANEMAFPETTFVFPPDSEDTDRRVRIFTPARELPMAGHPTIGTTFALAHERIVRADRNRLTLGLGVGPTEVTLEWASDGDTLQFAWMKQSNPVFGPVCDEPSGLAAALGVSESHISRTMLPVCEGSSGVPFFFVPLATRAAVNQARVDQGALRSFFDSLGMPERPVFVFTLERGDDDATVFSRMFAPLFGIPEDPATGGASGPLGAYLVRHGAIDSQSATRIISLQGVAMGRPSRIAIRVDATNDRIDSVQIGGTSLLMGEGFLDVR
jgi:trans-2,3-dihydro-3-hydroxyanthranilate isomerase